MMSCKYIIMSFICGTFLRSCGIIEINGSGYKGLSMEDKANVKVCLVPIDSLKTDSKVYQVTANQVKNYLNAHGDVILYEWRSFCKSKACISPSQAEKVCNEKGYEFCIVACDYDYLGKGINIGVPLLAINMNAYGTDNIKKYTHKFFSELLGERSYKDLGVFHRFSYGHYVCSYENVDDIQKNR